MVTTSVERALFEALDVHWGQVDKAGDPYILHVARVAGAFPNDPEVAVVAALHDCAEDFEPHSESCAGWWDRGIVTNLNSAQKAALQLLTRHKNRSYQAYIDAICAAEGRAGRIARLVKEADILDHANGQRGDSPRNYFPYLQQLTERMRFDK